MMYSNILILKMSSLGDVIMTLPSLKLLRLSFPDSKISWLVNKSLLPLLQDNPCLNEALPFDRKKYGQIRGWLDFFQLARSLREKKYDLVLDYQGLLRSGYLTFATKSPTRVGPAENREFSAIFYNHRISIDKEKYHAVDRYLEITKQLPGIQIPSNFKIEFPFPDFGIVKESLIHKLSLQGSLENHPLIVMAPSARWETKRWLPERFAELADRLIHKNSVSVVFIGGPEDHPIGKEIESMMKEKVINLIGKTNLTELALLFQYTRLLISNDTGPLHLASALGTPVVALFGPTKTQWTGPYGKNSTVLQVKVPCGPCLLKKCPGYGLICMKEISTDMVYNAVLPYLETDLSV